MSNAEVAALYHLVEAEKALDKVLEDQTAATVRQTAARLMLTDCMQLAANLREFMK